MYKKVHLSSILLLVITFLLNACTTKKIVAQQDIKIAFMSDVHLQDIYASFSDTDYKGVKNPGTGNYNTIRTMEAQLHSTRLFNENYFAFLAALDDAVERGIKIIALPGDFTDDGQPMNVRGLRRILDEYSNKHKIKFLITTGNHDPVRPVERHSGKTDFLGEDGSKQAIFSIENKQEVSGLPPVITQDVKDWGYKNILEELSDFGFFPNKDFVFWATPFSQYNYEDYDFKEAKELSKLENRKYSLTSKLRIPDASYLVEPIAGVWLLAIDGNVYLPSKEANEDDNDPKNYNGASIGYNNVLTHKKHLIDWVRKVAVEAKMRGKHLVAFSHYPMVEFNDGTSEMKKKLFGNTKMQLHRVPKKEVASAFANAGLKVHFGGHMHINDTGIHKTDTGNFLVNVQTPSLAAYPAAYKILTITSNELFKVETVPLGKVPRFSELFPLYKKEHDYISKNSDKPLWNKSILTTKTYQEYVTWHLKELVRLRFIPNDWPTSLKEKFLDKSGTELLEKAFQLKDDNKITAFLKQEQLSLNDFDSWTGLDMVFDFYRLQSGDELALEVIAKKRVLAYKLILKKLTSNNSKIEESLRAFAEIFKKQFQGLPSNKFNINLSSGEVIRLH